MNARLRLMGLMIAGWSVGCGGNTFTEGQNGGDAAPADGGAQDGDIADVGLDSSPPLIPGCPTSAPAEGTSCATESLECEYGDAWWNVACDVVMQCDSGQWQTAHLSYEPCTPEPGPNPASCPATSMSVAQGSVCEANDSSCYYPDAFCQCIVPLGGPVQIDGGTAYWSCLPGNGCPYPRPVLGSACTAVGTYCTYEECSYGQSCTDGAWQGSEEACASAGGP